MSTHPITGLHRQAAADMWSKQKFDQEVRKYLEEKAGEIHTSSLMLHPKTTWLDAIKEILGIRREPEWCDHMEAVSEVAIHKQREGGGETSGYFKYIDPEKWNRIAFCLLCGKERPKI